MLGFRQWRKALEKCLNGVGVFFQVGKNFQYICECVFVRDGVYQRGAGKNGSHCCFFFVDLSSVLRFLHFLGVYLT